LNEKRLLLKNAINSSMIGRDGAFMKRMRGTLLGLVFFALPYGMGGPYAQMAGAGITGAAPSIEVLLPRVDIRRDGKAFESADMTALVELLAGQDRVSVSPLPLRRAYARFSGSADVCIIDMARPLEIGEIESSTLFAHRFWLYASAAGGVRTLADVKRAGTIMGADLLLPAETMQAYHWFYTVNYENLIAMLRGGRVDAVTLTPRYFRSGVGVGFPLRRLGTEPLITVNFLLRCKETEATRRLIELVDARWAERRAEAD
jgi:hypothetical protein